MIQRNRWYRATAMVPSGGEWVSVGERRVCVMADGGVFVTHTSGDARCPPGQMQLREFKGGGFVGDGVVEHGRGCNRREYLVVAHFVDLAPER